MLTDFYRMVIPSFFAMSIYRANFDDGFGSKMVNYVIDDFGCAHKVVITDLHFALIRPASSKFRT